MHILESPQRNDIETGNIIDHLNANAEQHRDVRIWNGRLVEPMNRREANFIVAVALGSIFIITGVFSGIFGGVTDDQTLMYESLGVTFGGLIVTPVAYRLFNCLFGEQNA